MRTRAIARLRQVPPPAQRREHERFPSGLDVSVRPIGSPLGCFWTARVWDVSAVGISFHLRERIPPGTILEVEIVKKGSPPRKVLARVAHATDHAGGSWIIGCDLDRTLDEREVKALACE
jgi:hypothetical protein